MALTVPEIIELAHNLTERRTDQSKLDLNLVFHLALQELLHQNRFWWARGTATFNTVADTRTYDLSSASYADRDDIWEIIRVWRVDSATEMEELEPITEESDVLLAQEATVSDKPSCYMIEPDGYLTLGFGAPADGVYKIRLNFYRGHNPTFSESVSNVPIVPGPLHYGLVIMLKRQIYNFLLGQKDPRFIVANEEFKQFIRDAARKPSYSAQVAKEFNSGDAVRAF